jgi:hypothetical protein
LESSIVGANAIDNGSFYCGPLAIYSQSSRSHISHIVKEIYYPDSWKLLDIYRQALTCLI